MAFGRGLTTLEDLALIGIDQPNGELGPTGIDTDYETRSALGGCGQAGVLLTIESHNVIIILVPGLQPPGAAQDETQQRWTELMDGVSITRSSNLPLHARISETLFDLIENGKLTHGQRLPPQQYLAHYFGVSLVPVRPPVLRPVNKALRVRARRHGTFVRPPGSSRR